MSGGGGSAGRGADRREGATSAGSDRDVAGCLMRLGAELREQDTVISPQVAEPAQEPVLGPLAAAGPRAADSPGEYALIVEAVLEGYLLHFGVPRLVVGDDRDLALLAGDHLYALGLERLATLGDAGAVVALSDLISLVAECQAEERPEILEPLWLAGAVAVGFGAGEELASARESARRLEAEAGKALREAAAGAAERAGAGPAFHDAAKAIDFPAV